MAVNPNIILGVQPVQPTNMLGTAAQAIALKAAMQDIQGGEAMRNVFAQGGDLNDPEMQRRLMAANPKAGADIIKKQADIRKTQIDTLKDELAIRRDALSGVSTPEDYLAWHRANHSGQMGQFLNSIGIKQKSDDELLAEISKPGGLQKAIQASALGATKLQQELMQTERTLAASRISAGPGYAQAQIARERLGLEQAQLKATQDILRGGGMPAAAAPANALMGAGGAPAAAPANALVTGAAGDGTMTVSDTTQNVAQQVARIDTQIAQLSQLGTKPAADQIRALTDVKKSLIDFEKFKVGESATGVIVDPATGQPVTVLGRSSALTNQFTPVASRPPGMAVGEGAAVADIVRAPETAVEAKRRESFEALPGAVQSAENAVNLITRMVGDTSGKIKPHPGFQDFVGATYKPGARFIPGTNASDFQGLHNQITGRAFLEAFETLKGGGAITEAEGTKATQAITRMSASLSEEEYLKAAREFQGIVEAGLKRAKAKLQGQRPGAAPPAGGGGGGGAKADPLGIR